jgi:hypothetical protein
MRDLLADVATTIFLILIGAVRIMLSILAFDALLLAAAANQVILTLFGRRHSGNYCVANRKDTGVADVVDRDNTH